MKKNRRPMGAMERTQAITGRHYPFNVVAILQVVNGPSAEQLKIAADVLLHRHPILSAEIIQQKHSFFFQVENPKEIMLNLVHCSNKNTWQKVAEEQLDMPFDSPDEPLMRLHYISGTDYTGESEIIISFHHVAIDAASGGYLVDELLTLCTKEKLQLEKTRQRPDDLTPPAETFFPSSYQGIRRTLNNIAGRRNRQLLFHAAFHNKCVKNPKFD